MRAVSLAGTALDPHYHVCAFFGSRDDEYRVLTPFYQETLQWGEKLLHVIDDQLRADHEARLARRGLDVYGAQQTGQFEIRGWEETYLRDGAFDPDRMLATLQQAIEQARIDGYSRARIAGNMNWALDRKPDSERLIEYEVRVNEVVSRERQPAICIYDLTRLTGGMMMDLLRAHPLTLINGVVQHNQFFTPPDEMLAEIRQRDRRIPVPVE
jgi:hypothetical protein